MKMKKIQELPEFQRKIIFWAAMFFTAILVFYFGFKIIGVRLKELSGKNFLGGLELPDTGQVEEQAQGLKQEFKNFQELQQMLEEELEGEELNQELNEEQ